MQNFSEKLGPDWLVLKFWRKNISEINMIETRPKRIGLKQLTNKYRANCNHHVWKFDTGQKLDIIDAAEFDSSTALYYLVNLVARILQNYSLFLDPRVAMPEFHTEEKKLFHLVFLAISVSKFVEYAYLTLH